MYTRYREYTTDVYSYRECPTDGRILIVSAPRMCTIFIVSDHGCTQHLHIERTTKVRIPVMNVPRMYIFLL